jgi:hypothetical protein
MRPVWVKRGLYWRTTCFRDQGEYMIRLDRLNKYSLFTAHGRRGARTPVHTCPPLGLISLCNAEFFAKFFSTVITTALDCLVPMTTHSSTLDCCHPLLLMTMMMIHPQMHHQVMLQDLLSCTNLFQYDIVQSFCSGTWPKHRQESLF